MNVIIGLGNPGQQYAHSRHNAGWMAVDVLARLLELQWEDKPKLFSQIARGSYQGTDWLLVKPQTFMNESGKAVQAVLHFFRIEAEVGKVGTTESVGPSISTGLEKNGGSEEAEPAFRQVVVLFDDLDLGLGNWKVQWAKGPKVHNGLLSVVSSLSTEQFWHGRLGVDARTDRSTSPPGMAYVLQAFTAEQQITLHTAIDQVLGRLLSVLEESHHE